MPNFDALRTSTLGALSYLCKPQPPQELLGCWPISHSQADVSRYGHPIATSLTYSSGGTITNGAKSDFQTDFQTLNFSGDWSLDFHFYKSHQRANCVFLQIGNLYLGQKNNAGIKQGIWWGGTSLGGDFGYEVADGYQAFCKTGNTLYIYTNGAKVATVDASSFAGTSAGMTVGFHNYSGSSIIQNLRVIQKAIGTASGYPVTTSLYTGYEAL